MLALLGLVGLAVAGTAFVGALPSEEIEEPDTFSNNDENADNMGEQTEVPDLLAQLDLATGVEDAVRAEGSQDDLAVDDIEDPAGDQPQDVEAIEPQQNSILDPTAALEPVPSVTDVLTDVEAPTPALVQEEIEPTESGASAVFAPVDDVVATIVEPVVDDAINAAPEPAAVAPTLNLVSDVTDTLTEVTEPATDVVETVVDGVDTITDVVTPVTDVVDDIVGGIGGGTQSVVQTASGILAGGDGDDILSGLLDDDYLNGGNGNDILIGGAGGDQIHGGAGDDRMTGDEGDDLVYGYIGDDDMSGGSGDDVLHGGDGKDFISGGADDDELSGGFGDDVLIGGAGNDNIQGSEGNDIIDGVSGESEAEKDYLNGSEGDDRLIGNNGDVMSGGEGADTFDIRKGTVSIMDYEDDDLLVVSYQGDAPVLTTETTDTGVTLLADGAPVASLFGVSNFDVSTVQLVAG